jgi:hypothetical protein
MPVSHWLLKRPPNSKRDFGCHFTLNFSEKGTKKDPVNPMVGFTGSLLLSRCKRLLGEGIQLFGRFGKSLVDFVVGFDHSSGRRHFVFRQFLAEE